MNAALESRERPTRPPDTLQPLLLLREWDVLATARDGIAKLRELILTLAIQGKLSTADKDDEPASALLSRARLERDRLVSDGVLRGDNSPVKADNVPQIDLPAGWQWVAAANVCLAITDGDHQPPPKAAMGVPFLVIGDIRDGSVNLQNASRFVPQEYFDGLDWAKKPRVGDILYTTVGSLGIPVPVVREECFSFQRHVAIFRPAFPELQPFLVLALRSRIVFNEVQSKATGIAQKTVPLAALRALNLPLPPLAEQARIVARVDELMRLCDALEAKGRVEAEQHARLLATLLGTLTDSRSPEELAANWQRVAAHFDLLLDRPHAVDALEETVIQLAVCGKLVPQQSSDEPASNLLARVQCKLGERNSTSTDATAGAGFELPQGWRWARIEALADVQGGLQKTPLRRPMKNHFPYLRVANVQRDALDLRQIERFELTNDELARWRLHTGDILIIEGNGSETEIGRCALWNGAIDPCVYQNHLIRVRCPELECVDFIRLFLNSPPGRAEMKRLAITTSGLFNLSVGKIRNFVVPVPPLPEQRRIVARVAELRSLCAELRQFLTAQQTTQARLADALVESATA